MKYITDLEPVLNRVEKPGRYVGGEYGVNIRQPDDEDLRVCVVFPDLYEIAMSNQAVRILYKLFNSIEGVHAERAFSPAPDFQDALREINRDLYSLETGTALHHFDILAVTIGYELAFTNLLSLLKSGGIPLRCNERQENHPVIIAGGPALTNPAPWSPFVDAVYIGEAEGVLPALMKELRTMKTNGAGRQEILERIGSEPGFWTPRNSTKNPAKRVSWPDFGQKSETPPAYPVPSISTVQDHGVVEIMRGCPNKCRFCHAGVFYRPFRQKKVSVILKEAEYLVNNCGYRDITLSSLSTGDFSGLEPLVEQLNRLYSHKRISFSLPSLRVNSVTLSLIGRVGAIRKSGLTFAVETPTVEGQRGINKEVPAERVVDILREAKKEGWKLAKFYFMLGLPVDTGDDEVEQIVLYLNTVQKSTGMNLNVSFGTFIPKPHTPFERSAQLSDETAMAQINRLKDGLRGNKRIRFSFHSPFVSFLEGILSRGDVRAGELAYQAWLKGAQFDAWDDRMNRDAWREAISEADWDVEKEVCRAKTETEDLPWSSVSLGVNESHLRKEKLRSDNSELTVPCTENCTDHCGVCNKDCRVQLSEELSQVEEKTPDIVSEPQFSRILVFFRKFGPAVFFGHLDIVGIFGKSLQRSGIHVDFSRGFNPKPRIEFAQPLSLGFASEHEVCTVLTARNSQTTSQMMEKLNHALPDGIEVTRLSWIGDTEEGRKTKKVMSAFWGSDWLIKPRSGFDTNPNQLLENLKDECRKRNVLEDFDAEILNDSVKIRLRHGGTKNHNLQNLLTAFLGEQPLSGPWNITRIKCWAKNGAGEPAPYEDVFAESQ